MIVPSTPHASYASRASRDLAARIDRTIHDYRREHPKTTNTDVHQALQEALQQTAGAGRLSPTQVTALVMGIGVVSGALAIVGNVANTNGGNVMWPILGSFVLVAMVLVFVVARHHG